MLYGGTHTPRVLLYVCCVHITCMPSIISVQQLRDSSKIAAVQMPGTENPADYFTKILPRAATVEQINTMLFDLPKGKQGTTIEGSDKTIGATVQGSVEKLMSNSTNKRGRAAGKRKKKRN